MQALALGDTRGLSDADWEHLRALGLTHLVAISGFHVGVVAGFGVLLCRLSWWLCPVLGRCWPRPQAAAWGAALAAAAYAVARRRAANGARGADDRAGGTGPCRTSPGGCGAGLALAAMVMLLPAPLSVLSAGFWLSFGGVLWLLWCLPRTGPEGAGGGLRGFLAAQGVASLGLLPLCVALFGGTARLGPLVNLPIIPWWTLLVVPLSLLGTGLHALHEEPAAGGVLRPAVRAELAGAAATGAAPAGHVVVGRGAALGRTGGIGGGVLVAAATRRRRWPGGPAAVPAAVVAGAACTGRGELELLVHDVGQGTAVLVRTARHALWYDVGPPTGGEGNERILVPALRALGRRRPGR